RWHQMDLPAGPSQQGGFDEVMAENGSAQRRPSRQGWQAGRTGERLGADDGVVPPVVPPRSVPGGKARRDDRAIVAGGKLLQASEGCFAADKARHGLDQARAL